MGLERERLELAVSLEPDIEGMPVEWLPTYAYAGLLAFTDDVAAARTLYQRLHESAVESGDERELPTILFAMSQLESRAGEWSLALRYAAEAVDRSRQSGLMILHANALSAQAAAAALVGDVGTARAAAKEGLRIANDAGAMAPATWLAAALGVLELSLGDPAAAHGHLGPLADVIAVMGLAEPGVVRFLPDEIEALIALGDLPAASRLLELLEERGRALDRPWALAGACRCRALLEASRGDFAAARQSVAEALSHHARLGQPFELGRTLLAQGSIERRAKSRTSARQALTAALELFDELGAALWAERAAAELARIPGRRRVGGGLSETERRVAELAAEGKSNKEIAAALFVTVRAVEANLSRTYARLGIRSRVELAAVLARERDEREG